MKLEIKKMLLSKISLRILVVILVCAVLTVKGASADFATL